MKYRLIVVTHGGDEHTKMLQNVIASFEEMVAPAPTERVLIEDGPKKLDLQWKGARFWSGEPRGFCATAEMAWMTAAADGCEFAFWLEHDFIFRRPVYLRHLAEALEHRSKVAQMSLMRQPCNPAEVKAGGVVALDPEAFAPKILVKPEYGRDRLAWLEHGRYWTTNPSLFRCALARDNEWPLVAECEGVHTIGLRQQGYSFGVWGDGSPWVEHIGQRTGFGY